MHILYLSIITLLSVALVYVSYRKTKQVHCILYYVEDKDTGSNSNNPDHSDKSKFH